MKGCLTKVNVLNSLINSSFSLNLKLCGRTYSFFIFLWACLVQSNFNSSGNFVKAWNDNFSFLFQTVKNPEEKPDPNTSHCFGNTYWYKKKVPSISLTGKTTGTMGVSKFIGIEIITQALLEGRWYTGTKTHQIGQNWLCDQGGIFKRAWDIISIPMNFDTPMVPLAFSVNEMLGTFFCISTSSQQQWGALGCVICVKMLKNHDYCWDSHSLTLVDYQMTKFLKKNSCLGLHLGGFSFTIWFTP